jgi:hypothetical protein
MGNHGNRDIAALRSAVSSIAAVRRFELRLYGGSYGDYLSFIFFILYAGNRSLPMPLYPESVARCQHIKVNGTQCGSPALRDEKYCYFHLRWALKSMEIDEGRQRERWNVTLSLPEDADSIQMGVGEVLRLMMTRQVDHRTAAVMLYALQTASVNLKRTSLEPLQPTRVVVDRESVARRPIGATAWSKVEGREYDELLKEDEEAVVGAEERSAALRLVLQKFGPHWREMVEER